MPDETCVFCQIVDGSMPSSQVAETEALLAFMDADPVTRGHLLVIPKEHLRALGDLSDAIAAEMMVMARHLAAALRRSALECEGVNLFYADGEAAFQEVFHAHLHVFPRWEGDGFTIGARWGSNPGRDHLDAAAAEIRSALPDADR